METSQDQQNQKPKKKRRRWPWILLVVVVVLLITLRLLLQSDWLFGIIKTQAEQAVTDATGTEFTIGKMQGDLLRSIEMKDARLGGNEPMISLDSLHVRYNLFALFSRTIDVTSLRISGLDVRLEQLPDSSWNIMHLAGEPDPEADDEPASFPFTLELRSLVLENSRIDVHAPYLLPDDFLLIDEINAAAELTYSDDYIEAGLHDFSLKIQEGRLPEAITLETAGALEGDLITLDRLLISTGRSALRAEGRFNPESGELGATVEDTRINRADLAAYLDDIPEFEQAHITLRALGDLSEIEAGFGLHAPGLIKVDLKTKLGIEPELYISSVELELDEINLQRLAGDPDLDAAAGRFTLFADGHIPLERYEEAVADIRMELASARFEHISLADFKLNAALNGSELETDLQLLAGGEPVSARAKVSKLWSDMPEWQLNGRIRNLNPAYFADNPELDGRINLNFEASGTGIEPHDRPWRYAVDVPDPRIMEYDKLGEIRLEGSLTSRKLDSRLNMDSPGGKLKLSAIVEAWQEEIPEWEFDIEAEELDLSVLANLEDIPTYLNFEASAKGRGTDPEGDLKFDLLARIFDSRILEEPFDKLHADLSFEDSIVLLNNVELESRFVSGTAGGRQSVKDFTDTQNRLDFDFNIGNLEPFAELAGADTLHASGSLKGSMSPQDGIPVLETELNISSLIFDEINVHEIRGNLKAFLRNEPEIHIDITLEEPGYGEMALQDIHLINRTHIRENEILGDIDFRLIREGDFGLFHKGEFRVAEEITLDTSELTLSEDGFEIALSSTFSVRVSGEGEEMVVRMDTLSMRSEEGAHLQLHAQTGPGSLVEAWINASQVDVGAFQDVLLDERIADMYFNGEVHFRMEDEDLYAHIDTELTDIDYNGIFFESYRLNLDIADNRMEIDTRLMYNGDEMMYGNFSLPFRIGDPEEFPDSFYDEFVEGELEFRPTDLSDFKLLFADSDAADIVGDFSMTAKLGGTAGKPELDTRMQLDGAEISGVSIDEAWLELKYINEDSEISVSSRVRSLGQTAAELEGTLPLFIDMRTFTISEPDESEGVQISAKTFDFDVSVFNEFLDRDVARNLRGKLNADIEVTGTAGAPEPRGSISFTEGRVQLVENNIAITNMRADIGIEPDRIRLRNISAESSGSFSLSGDIFLEEFFPESFDIQARMRNFRVSNTRDLDVFVSMDTRLQDTMDSPRLTGGITVERGAIYLDNFGERQIEQVVLEDEEAPDTFAEDFFDALSMELNLAVTRRFFVRNRSNPELDLALEGSIDAVKEQYGELELFGDVNTVRGSATTLGRRFQLDEGVIIFSGPPDNPEFDIQLSYRVRREDDIRIIYKITGNVEEPEFTFDSEPEMELQDIISYTIFGRPFHALQSWEQGAAGSAGPGDAVADAALDLLLDRLQTLAADRLGVDVVEVDTSTQNGGTRVKAGKFLSDRLFVALVQELGSDPNSQVIIEYLLRRNLELIFTGSDDYRTGVDVLWKLDY